VYNATGSAWTFSGNAGLTGHNSPFTAGNPPIPNGGQALFLQGTGSASQTFPLTGGTYAMSLLVAQRANVQATSQTIRVLVDGVPVATFRPPGAAYTPLTTASFTLAQGFHTITIAGLNPNGGDNTALVDALCLKLVASEADFGFEQPAL